MVLPPVSDRRPEFTAVVLLAIIGLLVFIKSVRGTKMYEWILLLVWLLLPVGLQIVLKSNVYDNFRQFLFVLPPLFILAGIGLEVVISRIPRLFPKLVLAVFCVLPGLIGVISLHPYQYIYYKVLLAGCLVRKVIMNWITR